MLCFQRFAIASPEDGKWGIITENGTWAGMIGYVAAGEADLAMADVMVKFDRCQVGFIQMHMLLVTYFVQMLQTGHTGHSLLRHRISYIRQPCSNAGKYCMLYVASN